MTRFKSVILSDFEALCCITNHKDTILKANHNGVAVVASIALLYYQSQRYNFESKSQQDLHNILTIVGCITNHKDTILKANHNIADDIITQTDAVLPITKIQF